MRGTIRLFGDFAALSADRMDVDVPGQKERALLAILATAAGSPVTRDRLAGLLWSDRADPQARDSLKHALASLKRSLNPLDPDVIAWDRTSAWLAVDRVEVDTVAYDRILQEHLPERDFLALSLYLGDFLAGIRVADAAFQEWLLVERARHANSAEDAALRCLQRAVDNEDPSTIVSCAEAVLAINSFNEEACRALMRHWSSRGETARALSVYQRLEDGLRRNIGANPEVATIELATTVRLTRVPASTAEPVAPGLAGRPAIAVLPFQSESGDPNLSHLSLGIAEDLIASLAQYRWFPVLSRNAGVAAANETRPLPEIANSLGARYLLEGSLRLSGQRIRLNGRLLDGETAETLWAGRYDRDLNDIADLQDELARRVAGAIEPELLIGESRRARARPPATGDAYDFHMRGVWHHNQQDRAEDFAQAIDWQRRAIEIDPGFARAHMVLARSLYARSLHGYSADTRTDAAECSTAASRAVALDSADAYSHYAMCLAHLMDSRPAEALAAAERAISINPSLALAYNAVGWSRIFVGRPTEAIEPLEFAIRLSPRDPLTYLFLSRLALAHYHLGDYVSALHFSEQALSLRKRHFISVVQLAALGQLNRLDEAKGLVPAFVEFAPVDPNGYWKMLTNYRSSSDREHLLDGLQRLGIAPEL